MTGTTLFGSNGKRNVYGYNDDDEVDEADRYNHATSGGTLADDWTYSFDGIGNRLSAVGPDTGNGTNISYTYTPSNTNSYTQIKRSGVNQNPVHDKDGNMTDRGNLDFIWDGEPRRLAGAEMDFRRKPGGRDERGARASQNRLIEVQGTGSTVKYDYDYLGRRVKRQANGSTETYLYDGWNPVVTYVNGTTTRKHTYTWGADYGTGGVGALIACRKHSNSKDHVYFYDGHGNVTQIMNQSGTIVAHYEYDAFGNLTKNVDQDGSGFNNENPFRFSTKFFNDETGHYYYGYRYYDPRDGRWLNRDPIGERGSQNLYAFVGNDGVNWIDYLGLETRDCLINLLIGHSNDWYRGAEEFFDSVLSGDEKFEKFDGDRIGCVTCSRRGTNHVVKQKAPDKFIPARKRPNNGIHPVKSEYRMKQHPLYLPGDELAVNALAAEIQNAAVEAWKMCLLECCKTVEIKLTPISEEAGVRKFVKNEGNKAFEKAGFSLSKGEISLKVDCLAVDWLSRSFQPFLESLGINKDWTMPHEY